MSPSSSLSALRHRLMATVCCCFGQGAGGLGERTRWRRRADVGEFRYDPLSYALNFDEGDGDEEEEEGQRGARARRGDGLLYHSFSSRLSTPAAVVEVA
ncbi:hypothetical protein Zm00014a_039921 [Zea mays]|uniref:Uncharacterized protein n=1 Tax=Zea mays TaxID=4577 RepID=A0A3L6ETG0_MAIZE|nr:hypothetical protein Zm00014a_039921 [Zea mays]